MSEIKNWKLKEISGRFEVIHNDSMVYQDYILNRLGVPQSKNLTGLNREETIISWQEVPDYHSFFFDREKDETYITRLLENSILKDYKKLVILYGHKEPTIKVQMEDFFKDWEGFVRSTIWETIMHTEDLKYIIEISRDYFIHSNFKIVDKPRLQ